MTLQTLRKAALLSKAKVPATQGEAGGSSHGDALACFRHGPTACGCAHCHQRQPHLGAKLQSASSRPTSPRLMTAYTRTFPLSQDDPNAYFTSTCGWAPFLPASISSCLSYLFLLLVPHPRQLLSFFFLCHTYHILVSIPRVALQARVPKHLWHDLIVRGTPPLPGGLCTRHSNCKLSHN